MTSQETFYRKGKITFYSTWCDKRPIKCEGLCDIVEFLWKCEKNVHSVTLPPVPIRVNTEL